MNEMSNELIEQPLVKRFLWTVLVAGTGALASVVAHRVAARLWEAFFGEEPPE